MINRQDSPSRTIIFLLSTILNLQFSMTVLNHSQHLTVLPLTKINHTITLAPVRSVASRAVPPSSKASETRPPWGTAQSPGSSDVVAFGNAYARSFGYSVFSRASVPGMAGAEPPAPSAPVAAASPVA